MDDSLRISGDDSNCSSPRLSAFDSSTAIILIPDDEDSIPFEFTSEDEDDSDPFHDGFPVYKTSTSIPPLPFSAVFLYLLSPYLKLGAILLAGPSFPLKYSIPALLFFAVLSAFVRQIWYMMARYLKKVDMEDVVLDAFVRGRGTEKRREVLRGVIRGGTILLRILLATVYLRVSVAVLLPLLPSTLILPTRIALSLVAALLLLPLSLARSLGSKRILYTTWLSIATYITWLGCVAYSHTRGTLAVNAGWWEVGILWQGITTSAFAFSSSNTLPLYASLRASLHSTSSGISTTKTAKTHSFKTLSALSVTIAVCLTLPLTFFSSAPNHHQGSSNQRFIPILNGVTLLLGIPPILITTPALPLPLRLTDRLHYSFPAYTLAILILVTLLSVVSSTIFHVLSNVALILALIGTYFLPALIHITTHNFKRPLSIIMPSTIATPSHSPPHSQTSSPTLPDELLQRKETTLQRRQWRKRLLWDIGVWVLLIPVGGGGIVWAIIQLVNK